MGILNNVIKNVLTALYQYFWVSLLFAFLVMALYLFVYEKHASGQGMKKTFRLWGVSFKHSREFRLLFFLVFYGAMIGFRTLLNRTLYINPLQDILGGWELFTVNASGTAVTATDGAENILLFVPFSLILLWFLHTRQAGKGLGRSLWVSIRSALIFSLIIEFSQLLCRLGTFQFSDLVYNTLGGVIGSLLYWIGWETAGVIKKFLFHRK